jgi:hypothetical protein
MTGPSRQGPAGTAVPGANTISIGWILVGAGAQPIDADRAVHPADLATCTTWAGGSPASLRSWRRRAATSRPQIATASAPVR